MRTIYLALSICMVVISRNVSCKPLQEDAKGRRTTSSVSRSKVSRSNRENIVVGETSDDEDVVLIGGKRRTDVEILDPEGLGPPRVPEVPKEPPMPATYPPRRTPSFIGAMLAGSSGARRSDGKGRGGLGGFISNIMKTSSHPHTLFLEEDTILQDFQKSHNVSKSSTQEKRQSRQDDDQEEKSQELNGSDESQMSSEEEEPPGGGDGMGGGILGLLAGLSGDGGQSDLGSLLTAVGSIVANLSGGEGFDLNILIGSAVSLIAGILAGDGMKNIGTQIGIYLTTALSGITGGGAMNNGAFLGNLATALIGGSSAAGEGDSSESGGGSDSATFFVSLLSALFGSSSGR